MNVDRRERPPRHASGQERIGSTRIKKGEEVIVFFAKAPRGKGIHAKVEGVKEIPKQPANPAIKIIRDGDNSAQWVGGGTAIIRKSVD